MILIAIAVAEVLFWVLLVAGLLTRYALRAPRVGAALLIATPIVDLVLLALTYIDLSSTNSSNFAHGLSALYIGYSITLGPTIIRAMDVRFARLDVVVEVVAERLNVRDDLLPPLRRKMSRE